jgi:hypothetical protein
MEKRVDSFVASLMRRRKRGKKSIRSRGRQVVDAQVNLDGRRNRSPGEPPLSFLSNWELIAPPAIYAPWEVLSSATSQAFKQLSQFVIGAQLMLLGLIPAAELH